MSRRRQPGAYLFGGVLLASLTMSLAFPAAHDSRRLVRGSTMELSEGLSLLQHAVFARYGDDPQTCTDLANRGEYFTVHTCVGTPPQCFDIVADTGSDSVIVPSCACDALPDSGCGADDKCFQGTNKSSTFILNKEIPPIELTFGSGSIEAVVASDLVNVGGISTTMEAGVLLMTSRAELKITAEFEGILGLGPPREPVSASEDYDPKWFLKEAGVSRFSMCFRDGGDSGALRMNIPDLEQPIANAGHYHWGWDFQGASVGPKGTVAPSETLFCGPETIKPGADTPCGIIPDSGTTLIMGPQYQIDALFTEVCSQWSRCAALGAPSADTFKALLHNCSDWSDTDEAVYEIPSIFFHVASADGGTMSFELTAWAYITAYNSHSGIICKPTFGPMDYLTKKNGDVWLFGSPLFYEYDVMYDLTNNQMGLKQGSCEPCSGTVDGQDPLLLTEDTKRRSRPRVAHGQPRIHRYNVDIPL